MATVGDIRVIASIDTSAYKKGAAEIDSTNDRLEGSTSRSSSGMNKALVGVAKVGFAALATAAVGATALIVKNIDGAIKRIDDLVAFPRVLKALGISGEEAEAATTKLSDSLQGLPTSLSQGTRGVQGFITAGLDVNKATDAFLAFNNAMLAAGVEAGTADQTMRQLNQALSRGRIDGAEWNSIAANIPTVLQALSKESGKTTAELRELYSQNPQALIDEIIRLNEEGSGAMASLEEQARNATGGIGTAFANVDNAIQRAIQNIVTNLGSGSLEAGQQKISAFISNFGTAFGGALIKIGDGLGIAIQAIQLTMGFLKPLTDYISQNKQVVDVLNTTLLVLASIFLGAVIAAIVATTAVIAAIVGYIQFSIGVWTWLMTTAVDVWKAISNWAAKAYNQVVATWSAAAGFFGGVFNGIVSFFAQLPGRISSFFNSAWSSARGVWSSASGFFSGVVGGIVGVFAAIPGRISSFFSTALSQIKSIFSPSALISAGVALIDGLISGITSGFNKAKGVVKGKLDDLRGLFPFSPAKEGPFSGKGYTSYSGRALMDDFAKGMVSQSSTITSAARTAISGASSAFSGLENMNINAVGGSSAFDNLSGHGGGIVNNINTVNIASEVDGERWLRRLNGNQEIVSNGLVPTQSYM